jgi:predicted small lipoprotein YifL
MKGKWKMKKIILIVLALTLVFSLCACGGSEGCDNKPAENNNAKQELATSPIGYGLKVNGVTFGIGMGAEDVVKKLGAVEPVKSESCGDMGGDDYEYNYNDYVIYANDGGGAIRIYCVELRSDMVATAEGISPSASVDEVKEIYGAPTSESSANLIYEKDGMELVFFLKGDAVDAIQYREK